MTSRRPLPRTPTLAAAAEASSAPVRKQRSAAEIASADVVSPNRRSNILTAAERLFSVKGFHGTSIRDIAEEAGVPLALVGYYFGPKLDLYHQIFRERAGYIQARLDALATAQASAPKSRLLDEIVKAFVLPVLTLAASVDGQHFLRLLARGASEQLREDDTVIRELFDPLAVAFIEAFRSAAPNVSRQRAAWCYQFALGALLHHVNDRRIERLSLSESQFGDESAGPLLVKFIASGIRGVCSDAVH